MQPHIFFHQHCSAHLVHCLFDGFLQQLFTGWDEHGVYNFEGGCYAKTINLAEETEPDIYRAIHTDALLENVMIDPYTSAPDYFDTSITENGRVSYPIFHIDGYVSEDGRDVKTDEIKKSFFSCLTYAHVHILSGTSVTFL